MLTNSEWKWLADRKQWRFYSCPWCYAFPVATIQVAPSPCVKKCRREKVKPYCYGFRFPDFRDTALFEARVAAKLAGITESMMQTIQKDNITYPCYACPANENCAGLECREVLLRYARLQVEEEMNADR